MPRLLIIATSIFLLASSAFAATASKDDPPFRQRGNILVEIKGRGVYTYDGDKVANETTCFAQCRLLWPPMYAEPESKPKGSFTIFTRKDDGKLQWAFKGKPLYRWASDLKRGDAGGDRIAGVWRLIKIAPKNDSTTAPDKTSSAPSEKAIKN